VRLEFQLQGDLQAAFAGQFAQVSKGVDQGLDLTAKQTLDFGRVVMRQALGAKAANTIGRKTFEDTGARGIYNRWWRDGQNVPYAFSVGTTIRPKERQFLAVPSAALEAGQLPTDIFQPGQLPSLGRLPLPSTGGRFNRAARLSPRSLEYKLGVRLKYVPPGHGRRFGMLVIESARVTSKGAVRGSRRKVARYTFVAFYLVPETKLPQQLDWAPVGDFAHDRLEANVLDAIQTAVEGGVPQYEVAVH
jgi:hypothetical protein